MDLNAFDLESDPDLDGEIEFVAPRVVPSNPAPRPIATLSNSPGCVPAPAPNPAGGVSRPAMRRVRVDAWSVPASANWARPTRALRKVVRRAVESDAIEPA